MPGFPASNKLLQKKWQQRQHRLHTQKMHSMRTSLDNSAPQQYPHLVLRLKKIQHEEERQAEIDHNNQLLLQKMNSIMRSSGRLENWNDYQRKSLNRTQRLREQEKIAQANLGIARRLTAVQPKIPHKAWEKDFERHQHLREMWSTATKDFAAFTQGAHKRRADKKNDSDSGSAEGKQTSTFPKIDNQSSQHNGGVRMAAGTLTLPSIKPRSVAVAEADAKVLFKACKGMLKVDEAMVRTLIHKTYTQRCATRDKFEELFDLNLRAELIQKMGAPFTSLVDSLLAHRDADVIARLNEYIKMNEPSRVVEILTTETQRKAKLTTAFKKKYNRSMETAIKGAVMDEDCQTFLHALLKNPGASDGNVNGDLVTKDAQELYQNSEDRFKKENGIFMQLISERSFAHIQSVFANYKESNGRSVLDSMKEETCSAEFLDAVLVFGECLQSTPVYWANRLHAEMTPDNPVLLDLLLTHKEICKGQIMTFPKGDQKLERNSMPKDLLSVKKAFKKAYKKDLADVLLRKMGKEPGPLIASIVTPAPAKKNKRSVAQKVNGITIEVESTKTSQKPKLLNHNTVVSKTNSSPTTVADKSRLQAQFDSKDKTSMTSNVKSTKKPPDEGGTSAHVKFKLSQKLGDKSKSSSTSVHSSHSPELGSKKSMLYSPQLEPGRSTPLPSLKSPRPPTETLKSNTKSASSPLHKSTGHSKQSNPITPVPSHTSQVATPHPSTKLSASGSVTLSRTSGVKSAARPSSLHDDPVDGTAGSRAEPSAPVYSTALVTVLTSTKEKFDPSVYAEAIEDAMGLYTKDQEPLADLLARISNVQRQQLAEKYNLFYDKILVAEIQRTLGGDCDVFTAALFQTPARFDAQCLHRKLQNREKIHAAVIGIIVTRNGQELSAIQQAYSKAFAVDIVEDINSIRDSSRKLLTNLLEGHRAQGTATDISDAEQDAKNLRGEGGVLVDVSSATFLRVITQNNPQQASLVMEVYEKMFNSSLEDDIKVCAPEDTTCYHVACALRDSARFYAQLLHQAMMGADVKENASQVTQLLIPRLEENLPSIQTAFRTLTGRSLVQDIREHCAANYLPLLVAMVTHE